MKGVASVNDDRFYSLFNWLTIWLRDWYYVLSTEEKKWS